MWAAPGRIEMIAIEHASDGDELFEMWRALCIIRNWAGPRRLAVVVGQEPAADHVHIEIEGTQTTFSTCGEPTLTELQQQLLAHFAQPTIRALQ